MNQSDGSVGSSHFKSGKVPDSESVYSEGLKLVLGQIIKVHYTDDQSNLSKKYVEYDVVVKDAFGGSSTIRNLAYVSMFGGSNDHDEAILEACDFAFSGKLEPANIFKNKNGTTVVVAAFDGSKDKQFIIATIQHPKRNGAKRADGIRRKGEFRGVEWEINKDGEVSLTYKSDRSPDGKLKRAATGPTVVKIDKEGRFSITDKEGQTIKMDRVSKAITIITKENLVITVGKDSNVTITGNSNKTVSGNDATTVQGNSTNTISGNRTDAITGNEDVTIQGNESVTIQGNETVTTTGDRVHSAANHTLSGGGNIKIGSAGSSENLVLGNAFKTLYNAHGHLGNLGIPTGAPFVPMSAAHLSAKNFTE